MSEAFTRLYPHAEPVAGLAGGVMIGLASALILLGLGRIAGVSGLVARVAGLADSGPPRDVALAFVLGLQLGAFLTAHVGRPVAVHFPDQAGSLLVGGLLVGLGTRLGSGCTSGHGVCGLSRLSPRSLVATALFMASGFATVAALRVAHLP